MGGMYDGASRGYFSFTAVHPVIALILSRFIVLSPHPPWFNLFVFRVREGCDVF
mgnify:CR=1 FL=1